VLSRIEGDLWGQNAHNSVLSRTGSTIVELCDGDCGILMDAGEKLAVRAPKQIVGRYQETVVRPISRLKSANRSA
jgi:hypothetical protein